MKYLKRTILLFIMTLVLSSIGVNAKTYAITQLHIPIKSAPAFSEAVEKDTFSTYQMLQKDTCTDNLTHDERAINGYIMALTAGPGNSSARSLPKGKQIVFTDYSQAAGTYRSVYMSNKSLYTAATYWGVWSTTWSA